MDFANLLATVPDIGDKEAREMTIARMAAAMGAAREREKFREALRWYGQGAHSLTCNFLAGDKKAVMASLEMLALDGGKRAADLLPDA